MIQLQGKTGTQSIYGEVVADFLLRYKADPIVDTNLYPGCIDVLKNLSSEGHLLAICTNKPEIKAFPAIDAMGRSDFFDCILCGDKARQKKPSGQQIIEIMERMGMAAGDGIMVGDSAVDILAASDAGITSILVSYGYGYERAIEHSPEYVAQSCDEIARYVALINRKP